MSELDRERREMAAVLQRPGGASRPLAPDYPTHFHPQIVLDRRGHRRPDVSPGGR